MVSAEQARLNQIAASERFIAAAGQDAFDVTKLLSAIAGRRFQISRSTGGGLQTLLAANASNLAEAKRIFRKGNVDFRQLQNSNRDLLKTPDPQPVSIISTSPDIEERVIDRVAERIERDRKVKDGTSDQVVRIVEVGATGGEQLSTS